MDLLRGIQLTEGEAETMLHCLSYYQRWDTTGSHDTQVAVMRRRLELLFPEVKIDERKFWVEREPSHYEDGVPQYDPVAYTDSRKPKGPSK